MSLEDVLGSPSFWGLLGAIFFAAPKLIACLYGNEEGRRHAGRCVAETTVALVVGTIAAAAFSPWLVKYVGAKTPQEAKAMSTLVGILANPIGPGVISFLSESVLTRIKGGH